MATGTKKKKGKKKANVSKLTPFEEDMEEIDKLKNFNISEPK